MKKQKGSRIGTVIKSILNVRKWSDYDRLKSFTLYLGEGFRKMFIPQGARKKKVSFHEAVARMKLTEKDLKIKKRALLRLSILMCIMAIGIMAYSGYHFYYGFYKAALVSIVISMLGFVLAFRYHFWYFQIRERKLGCSFMEWFKNGLFGEWHD